MFQRPIAKSGSSPLVKVVTHDAMLARRLTGVLGQTGAFHVDVVGKRISELAAAPDRLGMASLLVIHIGADTARDLECVEQIRRAQPHPPATIVLADTLAQDTARLLLKLQVSDCLTTASADQEIISACNQAVRAGGPAADYGCCTTFISALGGAGATTLGLAAASVLARRDRHHLADCCVVDLDFQAGAVADYLDLKPNLELSEIAEAPERLDPQLLEVMLSRHPTELAVLTTPFALGQGRDIQPELVGRLLDLASSRFKHVIIDLPRSALPLYENVARGTDALFIVTELTVVGLRQAMRLADALEHCIHIDTGASVIVNKVRWLGGKVSKRHARRALGDRLAGFVGNAPDLVQDAQNRGLLLSQAKRRNRIEADLTHILSGNKKR